MRFFSVLKSFLCLTISVFFTLSLSSYNHSDPSFNRATNVEPENYLSYVGAYTAEPLLQFFGISVLLFILIPLSWSYVYYRYDKIKNISGRILSGTIAIISLCVLLYPLHSKNEFFTAGYGGVVGALLHKSLAEYFNISQISIVSSILFIVFLFYTLALGKESWGNLIISLSKVLGKFFSLILSPLKTVASKIDKSNEKTVLPLNKTQVKGIKITPVMSSSNKKLQGKQISEQVDEQHVSYKPKAAIKQIIETQEGFILPSTELLKEFPLSKENVHKNSQIIDEQTTELSQILSDFGVNGEMLGASLGPVVTLFEFEPAAGTKSSRVIGLSDDIARSMRALSTRIAVIPGRNAIGIELPNKQRETVYLKELLESSEYCDKQYDLPIILGKDISGNVIVADLARMPHLLVAGTTGSGKSVAINTMILSLVYALTPDQCKFIMVDPKMLELSVYDGIPHLLTNVVTEPGKAVVALKWVVKEMENRYRLMSNLSVRNIHNFNERIKEAVAKGEVINRNIHTGFDAETGKPKIEQIAMEMKTLPFIVVIVDEMADLMLVAGKEIETSIQRLAQMARAAGIHIIMATQRPSVDVITGVIKANFPTRISFQVTSKIDSRTILGEQGAEQLLGKGDMLYMAGGSKITRIHGPFVADDEVERIVSYLKSQGSPEYMTDITSGDHDTNSFSGNVNSGGAPSGEDELYKQAIEIIQQEGKVSISFIQRYLKIGYNRAANIIEQMERDGLVSKANSMGKREILM